VSLPYISGVRYPSEVKFADFDDLFKPSRHTLVIGAPRSGKTSFLLWAAYTFWKLGETVVVRDMGEFFEFLSLVEYREDPVPMVGFVPEGCHVRYSNPDFTQRTFDIFDLDSLMDQFEENKVNLIMFEPFSQEPKNQVWFWNRLFHRLLPWKRQIQHAEKKICFIIDELGDLAPGHGRTVIPGQTFLSRYIYVNHRKLRRHFIRLLASVHYFKDVQKPVRQSFDCYVVKRTYADEKEVPYAIANKRLVSQLRKMTVSQSFFIDSKDNFNGPIEDTPYIMKPLRFGIDRSFIHTEGDVDHLIAEYKETGNVENEPWKEKAETYRKRFLTLLRFILENGDTTSTELGSLLNITGSAVRDLHAEAGKIEKLS